MKFFVVLAVASAAVVAVIDVILEEISPKLTISYNLTRLMQKFPIVGIALGAIIGHLGWPDRAFAQSPQPG